MATDDADLAVREALRLLGEDQTLEEVSATLARSGADEDRVGRILMRIGSEALAQIATNGARITYRELLDEHLSDITFFGKENNKIRFILLAIAAERGGVAADFDDELHWWKLGSFRHYTLCAAVALIRAQAARSDTSVANTVDVLLDGL